MLTIQASSTLTRHVRMLSGMESVGDRLKRCRKEAGLTQDAVAKAIGATRSAIAQVEGGISNSLNGENIAKAAKLFGRHAVWLATGNGPEHTTDGVNDALDALPDAHRQQAFDFILYQVDRAKDVFSDRPADYTRMIEGIKSDMVRRRKSTPEPKAAARLHPRSKPTKKPA